MDEVAIVVHGGAWDMPDDLVEPSLEGVRRAAETGLEILRNGGSALDAVERAVVVLEDDPFFNAGRGSSLNSEGEVEMDAIIVDGESLRFGAVAAVRRVRNPVSLARAIMERTKHCMFVAQGAEKIASQLGFELIDPAELKVDRPKLLEEWWRARSDTVGAVALDGKGRLAAATSTGGIRGKLPGRVGDSAIIGSGALANNVAAVSATGHGESIMRVMLSRLVVEKVESGLVPREAAEEALKVMLDRTGGRGGVIVVDSEGRVGFFHTTKRMPVAFLKGGRVEALVEMR